MGEEMLSFVYGVHLLVSYECNASESDFKENLGIQDILIHQKAPNLKNSLLAYSRCVNVWTNMASLMISSAAI